MNQLLHMSLGALGVVYGDIGTSPLYAVNEIYMHIKHGMLPQDVLGFTSLVLWALSIIVSFKYVVYVLRADNDGEGGVFALYGLINQLKVKHKALIGSALFLAAGLLFGDGIITPAISVISAVEGLKVVTTSLEHYVVPITILILTGLFVIQSSGTAKIGKLFGPIVCVWFLSIAIGGVYFISKVPGILYAFNPLYAVRFLASKDIHTIFLVLGSVMLVVTGGEAMYADMGHFGRTPIRLSWFAVVYPALILNYLGQGAYLLGGYHVVADNIFYSMVPKALLLPMVLLATAATIIASQALISGAFSLVTQAISLGLLPYMEVVHTHEHHEGQIYVPFINWALYVGCVILVVVFGSSTRLASAYGLAVAGVMFVTSLAMIMVAINIWKWSKLQTFALFLPLAALDLFFLSANSLKIIEGGYIPLGIGVAMYVIIQTWRWGRAHTLSSFENYETIKMSDLIKLKDSSKVGLHKTLVVLTPDAIGSVNANVPTLKQMFLDRYQLIPLNLILLTVNMTKSPHVHGDRYKIHTFYSNEQKGHIVSVTVSFGFMEDANVEEILEELEAHHKMPINDNPSEWIVHAMHERIHQHEEVSNIRKMRFWLYKLMLRNTESADEYFGLGLRQPLTIEMIPVTVK